ncbi:uncharacterized protein LOC116430563 [Nomia melanderi]|uniref:uncharacterized protein LOC116430563 n=1 Tax=Nomia melanderi TaxID=2448451 RepID=UPI00130422B7|nr:uncharacterized protein LOC116430563 [Nomia melanderi]
MDVKRKRSRRKTNKNKTDSGTEDKVIEWSDADKRTLLEALKKHGSNNITAISKMLPCISPENIKLKISEYSTMANNLYETEILDEWLNSGIYKPGDSLIPEALLFIYLFEDHPTTEADGYDFRAIYKFLYRSCFEQPSHLDLSEKDLNLLYYALYKVQNKVWPNYRKEIWEYVGKIYNKKNIKKVYPGKTTDSL